MTWQQVIEKFLYYVSVIKSLHPAYKQPGDGSNGVCDCIGLIIGAIRRMGLKWTGIHGSNYAARYQAKDLKYIESVSQLQLGDAVLKGVDPDGIVRKACRAGTMKHKYDLPSRYKSGNKYYNGDMRDYYHAGVVTSVNPLEITHMTSPSMKVDKNLNNGWNYCFKPKPLVEAANGTVPALAPVPDFVPSTGSKAIVVSQNGGYVKLRQYPDSSCRTWDKVAPGTQLEVVAPGEQWCKVNSSRRKGWYMMSEFVDIIGDGKGVY